MSCSLNCNNNLLRTVKPALAFHIQSICRMACVHSWAGRVPHGNDSSGVRGTLRTAWNTQRHQTLWKDPGLKHKSRGESDLSLSFATVSLTGATLSKRQLFKSHNAPASPHPGFSFPVCVLTSLTHVPFSLLTGEATHQTGLMGKDCMYMLFCLRLYLITS